MRARDGEAAGRIPFLIAWVPYALLCFVFRWICDDAFIAFRFAKNWAEGNGLRFNPGDHAPVEGYSDFLWIAACAVLERFGANMHVWPLVLSFACGSWLLWILFSTLRRDLGVGSVPAVLAALFLGCSPPFFVWSTSGLETALLALALFATFQRLVLRRAGIAPFTAALAGLALVLVREEGLVWFLALVALAALSRHLAREAWLRPLLTCAALVLGGYAVYWTARYSYYGHPFSNTALVKVSIGPATLERGLSYVVVQFLTTLSLFAVVPGLVVAWRRKRAALALPIAAMTLATTLYPVLVSGDFLPMSRLLVASLPFQAVLFAWLLDDLAEWRREPRLAACVGGCVVAVGLLPAWNVHLVPKDVRARFHFRGSTSKEHRSEYEQWVRIKEGSENLIRRGRALKLHTRPGETIVTGAVGAVGYYSDLFVFDQNGLVTREVAERSVSGEVLRQPGHDKHVPESFFLKYEPTIMATGIAAAEDLPERLRKWRAASFGREYVGRIHPLPEGAEGPRGGGDRPRRETEYLIRAPAPRTPARTARRPGRASSRRPSAWRREPGRSRRTERGFSRVFQAVSTDERVFPTRGRARALLLSLIHGRFPTPRPNPTQPSPPVARPLAGVARAAFGGEELAPALHLRHPPPPADAALARVAGDRVARPSARPPR